MLKEPGNFLQLQWTFYQNLGIDLFDINDPWKTKVKMIWGIVVALNVPCLIAGIIKYYHELDLLVEIMCTVVVASLAFFKFIRVFVAKNEIVKLAARFRYVLSIECEKGDACAEIIIEENIREQRTTQFYMRCWYICLWLAGAKPLVVLITIYLRSGNIRPLVPIFAAYPWDMYSIYFYLLTIIWNVFTSIGCVHAFLCMDTLFFGLSKNLCALYKIAHHKIIHFKGRTLQESEANFAEAAHTYKMTLDLCDGFNDCFRSLVFAQFFGATLYLCVLCYEASMNLKQLQMLYYLGYVGTLLAQLFIYCYCGQIINNESVKVSEAVYDCPWYEVNSVGIRRSVVILLMRAQRGNAIDGYFFTANLETFLSIVRTAMSYVTLLNSFS